MPKIKVSVINASTVLRDDEVIAAMPALQTQVTRDFAPAWGIDAELSFTARDDSKPVDGAWWLVLLDDSDQASAYGYHDVTNDHLPLGKVFAGTDKKNGKQWTITASHELLEMLVDPEISLAVFDQSDLTAGGMLYAYEICDACQSEAHSYPIDGVAVSDFVFPAWFQASRARGSTQFDFCKKIEAPFAIGAGGYIATFKMAGGSGWQMKTAAENKGFVPRANVGTRRERRRMTRELWRPSSAQFDSNSQEGVDASSKGFKEQTTDNSSIEFAGDVTRVISIVMPVIMAALAAATPVPATTPAMVTADRK